MPALLILAVGILVVVGSILFFRLHAFLALTLGALLVAVLTPESRLREYAQSAKLTAKAADDLVKQPVGERVGRAFGNTCASIGIMIAMASIIGQCLLGSGGADRIVRTAVGAVGERNAPFAFTAAGFLLSIPVFFDTVFYLMIPLGKALAARTGKDYGLYVMTIAAGATISHSLVPPTPGPAYVAGELGVMAPMILAGIVIGGLSVIPGVAYAFYSNRRWPVPLRETPEVSLDQLRAQAAKDDRSLPPLGLALVPILLPVVLIIADVLYKGGPGWQAGAKKALGVLGNPNVALALSAAIALHMQLKFGAKDRAAFTASLESSLGSAGQIILITAAGGAFGGVLQHTGIAKSIEAMFSGGGSLGVAVLVGAFLVTALIRVAQGSATVAMVTAIGMFAGLAKSGQLGYHPVYLALAIGFGSKPVPWMNDSGFWVVCKMSGQTVGETLRNHSVVFTIMGVSGLIFTVLAAKLFPFVS